MSVNANGQFPDSEELARDLSEECGQPISVEMAELCLQLFSADNSWECSIDDPVGELRHYARILLNADVRRLVSGDGERRGKRGLYDTPQRFAVWLFVISHTFSRGVNDSPEVCDDDRLRIVDGDGFLAADGTVFVLGDDSIQCVEAGSKFRVFDQNGIPCENVALLSDSCGNVYATAAGGRLFHLKERVFDSLRHRWPAIAESWNEMHPEHPLLAETIEKAFQRANKELNLFDEPGADPMAIVRKCQTIESLLDRAEGLAFPED